jgi:hypothetical protein
VSKRRKREQRETSLDRRRPHREERRVYLVVCEGETEKRYFDTMKKHPDVRLHTVHARKAKHPQREVVVRSAAEAERDDYTERWAVFDTDGEDVAALVASAAREGIEAAPAEVEQGRDPLRGLRPRPPGGLRARRAPAADGRPQHTDPPAGPCSDPPLTPTPVQAPTPGPRPTRGGSWSWYRTQLTHW